MAAAQWDVDRSPEDRDREPQRTRGQGCAADCGVGGAMIPAANRVRRLFRRLKDQHRCGLIAYVTCGDGPTVEIIRALEDAGADAIELGVPFSDPIADGPVIQ